MVNIVFFLTWYKILLLFINLKIHSEVFNKGLFDHSDKKDEYAANQSGLLLVLITLFTTIYLIFYKFFNNLFELPTLLVLVVIAEIWANAMIGFWRVQKNLNINIKK